MQPYWRVILLATSVIVLLQFAYILVSHSSYNNSTIPSIPDDGDEGGPQMTTNLFSLLQERADEQTVTITFTNIGNIEMALNFLIEAKKVGLDNYIVISFDYETCNKMPGEPCYVDPSKTFEPSQLIWGTREYFEMINYRAYVWLLLLRHGYHVFCVDTDVFLRDNPFFYFDNLYDLNIMREYPSMGTPIWQTMRQLGLCCEGDERYLNAGFFYLRSTPASINVVRQMQKIMKEDPAVPDQDAFNIALLRVPEAKVRVLNKDLFPNGFVAYLQAGPSKRHMNPIVQHANWVRDHSAKTHRAREILSWHMDPIERYTTPRKYVTYITADDVVTPQMEKDYLQLLFVISEMLNRTVILPMFHCYIGHPPGCLLDALFDTYKAGEFEYFEHSLLHNHLVPAENLNTTEVYLPYSDALTLKTTLLKFKGLASAPLIRIIFPRHSAKYHHYALSSMPDRKRINLGSHNSAAAVSAVDKLIQYNEELLFAPWYVYWKKDLATVNYTCLLTSEQRIETATKYLKELCPTNALYVVSSNPGVPSPPALISVKDSWAPWVVWSYDFLWSGHKILKDHSVIVHLQMEACADADHVVVNMWEPDWLVRGVCDMRTDRGKTPCHALISDVYAV